MLDDTIRYDVLHSTALRGVIRQILTRVQKRGLPGEHFFDISFVTAAEGVVLSPRLLKRFPDVMTIVLQHRFWDLTVSDTGFEVMLTFNDVPEKLVIPFAAIVNFADPHAEFAFNPNAAMPPPELVALMRDAAEPGVVLDGEAVADTTAMVPPPKGLPAPAPAPAPAAPGGSVVQLDRFRRR